MTCSDNFNRIESMIGKTPLVKVNFKYRGEVRHIYAKAEYYNLSGSIKDRVAYFIMKKAYESGKIDKNYTVVEVTSGNTGIAFSAIGAYLGHKVRIYMPKKMSVERKKLIRSYGANIIEVSDSEGGFLGAIDLAEKFSQENNKVFLPRQFYNMDNVYAHYFGTALESIIQMYNIEETIHGFVSGIGTGGTIMGFAKRLKEENKDIKVYAMEPTSSRTLYNGEKGNHKIEGISDEFVPPIVDRSLLEKNIIHVDDDDAIIMSQMLSKKLGLGVGISSGANFIAAIKAQNLMKNKNANILTVFADDSKKYLSTDLTAVLRSKSNFITNNIELIDFESFRF